MIQVFSKVIKIEMSFLGVTVEIEDNNKLSLPLIHISTTEYLLEMLKYAVRFNKEIFFEFERESKIINTILFVNILKLRNKKDNKLFFYDSSLIFKCDQQNFDKLIPENVYKVALDPLNRIFNIKAFQFPKDDIEEQCDINSKKLINFIPTIDKLNEVSTFILKATCRNSSCPEGSIPIFDIREHCYERADKVRQIIGSVKSASTGMGTYGDGYDCQKIFSYISNGAPLCANVNGRNYLWGNHAAVVVKVGSPTDFKIYVIDPALLNRYDTIQNWINKQDECGGKVQYNITDANIFNNTSYRRCNFKKTDIELSEIKYLTIIYDLFLNRLK